MVANANALHLLLDHEKEQNESALKSILHFINL